MNIAALRAELEADQAWRRDEIRFLQNQASLIGNVAQQALFRRAVVVLLYAHFEGFCSFALNLYVNAINQTGISCGEANHALAAASLADILAALRDPTRKCDQFRNALPDDTQLHRFARDREFLERSSEWDSTPVRIPESVIDTESNLKPIVLKKNLYRLGLPHDRFSCVDGEIHRLLNTRNKIAHGETKSGVDYGEYEALRTAVFFIMDEVTLEVTRALREKAFLRCH